MKLKKWIRRLLIIILILLIVALGGIIYYFGFYKSDTKKPVKVIKEIPEYGYKLRDSANGKYKKLFKKLEQTLKKEEIDEEEYAEIITKLFIMDFYTLDNKISKTDIGGVEFVKESAKDNFILGAQDTYYKYLENDIYGKRKQNLPEVKEVKVESIENTTFKYEEETDEAAYLVKASWTYSKENDGYQDSAELIYVHDGQKLVLVELK